MTTGEKEAFDIHLFKSWSEQLVKEIIDSQMAPESMALDTTYLEHQTQVHANQILVIFIC